MKSIKTMILPYFRPVKYPFLFFLMPFLIPKISDAAITKILLKIDKIKSLIRLIKFKNENRKILIINIEIKIIIFLFFLIVLNILSPNKYYEVIKKLFLNIIIKVIKIMLLFKILFRTLFFYLFIVFSYKIMGKREIGQLGVIDLIVSILIAEMVAISIENTNKTIMHTIAPISLLVILEVSLAFISLKSRKVRNIFNSHPSVIILNGKVNYKEMVKQRYSLDDLLLQLRQKDIRSIEEVEYAILEANGKLSVFKYGFLKIKRDLPLPLVVDGNIQYKALKYLDKDKNWLVSNLKNQNIELDDIFYAFYNKNKFYVIKQNDIQ